MKIRLVQIVSIMSVFVLSSCSSMYIPSMGNAPLLEEQGEIQADVSLTTNAVQIGGAYAFTDHWAGLAGVNISYGNFTNFYDIYTSKDEDSTTLELSRWGKFNNRHYEVGVGYYNMCNSEHFKLEAFGGLGYSHAKDENDFKTDVLEKYDSQYLLTFVQLNTGFSSKYCDFGVAFRVAPTFHTLQWETIHDDASLNAKGTEHFTIFHLEPLVFLRLGAGPIKAVAKVGCSLPYSTDSYDTANDNVPTSMYTKCTLIHCSIGACLQLGK